jgi:uncharacterized membrane protein YeaQ/YmgE (transglycosylase-associated protein family)
MRELKRTVGLSLLIVCLAVLPSVVLPAVAYAQDVRPTDRIEKKSDAFISDGSQRTLKPVAPDPTSYRDLEDNTAALTIRALITWLIIGAIAGWLTGLIVKDYGYGLKGNIVVGIIGSLIAGWLLPKIGIIVIGGIIAEIINAIIGAAFLLLIIGFVKKSPVKRPI